MGARTITVRVSRAADADELSRIFSYLASFVQDHKWRSNSATIPESLSFSIHNDIQVSMKVGEDAGTLVQPARAG